jgi:isocitrate/isopropylmalate dehydrogenase
MSDDIVKRLQEKIIADAFQQHRIEDGMLADRLIRERLDAADKIMRLAAELAAERERAEAFRVDCANEFLTVTKLREALDALAKHCNDMEAQNHDYHALGECDRPRLSRPLADAYAALEKVKK